MYLEIWQVALLLFYFFWAGMSAEYYHNYTCNLWLSLLFSLVWPLMAFREKPKHMPKYYRDGHYKFDTKDDQ